MPKPRKAWTFNPGRKPKSALPGTLKDEVDTKARELIETILTSTSKASYFRGGFGVAVHSVP